jgi:hypothetical protein
MELFAGCHCAATVLRGCHCIEDEQHIPGPPKRKQTFAAWTYKTTECAVALASRAKGEAKQGARGIEAVQAARLLTFRGNRNVLNAPLIVAIRIARSEKRCPYAYR